MNEQPSPGSVGPVMIVRHVLSILLLPVMVTIVVPWWILRAFAGTESRWPASAVSWIPRTLGISLVLAGLGLVAWCIALFVRVGRGTLAPWDPTTNLVAVGPYQYTRNPMITGVCVILTGEALVTGSWHLGLWALFVVALNHVHFLLVEEPGLEQRFGAAYLEYKRSVPRWIPRLVRRR